MAGHLQLIALFAMLIVYAGVASATIYFDDAPPPPPGGNAGGTGGSGSVGGGAGSGSSGGGLFATSTSINAPCAGQPGSITVHYLMNGSNATVKIMYVNEGAYQTVFSHGAPDGQQIAFTPPESGGYIAITTLGTEQRNDAFQVSSCPDTPDVPGTPSNPTGDLQGMAGSPSGSGDGAANATPSNAGLLAGIAHIAPASLIYLAAGVAIIAMAAVGVFLFFAARKSKQPKQPE